jgi:hypothetical protein
MRVAAALGPTADQNEIMLRPGMFWSRSLVATLLVLASCASAASESVVCRAPAGVDALWRDPQIRYVVLGEFHGTDNMPAAAAEIACDVAARGNRTLVALEIPRREQALIEAYVSGGVDVATLLTSDWARRSDGTASVAMLGLLTRLRNLRHAGLEIEVAAVQGSSAEASDDEIARWTQRFQLPTEADIRRSSYDLRMAETLIDRANDVGAERVVLLVGEAHGAIRASPSSSLNSATLQLIHFVRVHAAAALPRTETLSLVFTHSGGAGMARTRGGETRASLDPTEEVLTSPAVVLAPYSSGSSDYDGRVFVGPVAPSPPAASVQ